MTDIKYYEQPGFSNQNTPEIYDQTEPMVRLSSKNRYIYDFSSYAGPTNQFALSGAKGAIYPPAWQGIPGETCKFITKNDVPMWESFPAVTRDQALYLFELSGGDSAYSLDATIAKTDALITSWPIVGYDNLGGENSTDTDVTPINFYLPYINEDAFGFINEAYYSDYLQTGTPSSGSPLFKAGYYEFSFQTTKKDFVAVYGSNLSANQLAEWTGEFIETGIAAGGLSPNFPVSIGNTDEMIRTDALRNKIETIIEVVNGKITFKHNDFYGNDKKTINFSGNIDVSDGKWHHVVVNIGRPGMLKEDGGKFAEKYIEIWVDGKLDKRFYNDKTTTNYIEPRFIMTNIEEVLVSAQNVSANSYNRYDRISNIRTVYQDFIGGYTPYETLTLGLSSIQQNNKLFRGFWRSFAFGKDVPLDKSEITFRYYLWNSGPNVKEPVSPTFADAKMINPAITTNVKKALKLFWNNIPNIDGIQLDDNYSIDTYCVTNKTKNSTTEIFNYNIAPQKVFSIKTNAKIALMDNVNINGPTRVNFRNTYEGVNLTTAEPSGYNGYLVDVPFSGLTINIGDRIFLSNQYKLNENGIWIFNGFDKRMTRPDDFNSVSTINKSTVYIEDGYLAGKSFYLVNDISTIDDPQTWNEIDGSDLENISSYPVLGERWTDEHGRLSFIDFERDLNIEEYNLIVFMNYPTSRDEINSQFLNENSKYVNQKYIDFIDSLRTVVSNGANLYVSSPLLAADLGIISDYTAVNQQTESSDAQSAAINPFEFGEPADQYFDTHRINKYSLSTEVPGLTDKETYILTDFINYTPEDIYKDEEYHAKYAYRQFGLSEGNEFYIPSLTLRKITENAKLAGPSENRKGIKPLKVVEPHHLVTGTPVTQLSNTYYVGSTVTNNPYDDAITTFIVHNGQQLNGKTINGKIFVNFIEDGYTMSREEYNYATIQNVPENIISETVSTRQWQYSTKRLNRVPKRINVSGTTKFGQTVTTDGGGGGFIQAPSSSSNGIIRSKTESGNVDYESDFYPTEDEEIYQTQKIPVLSMTWLGLQWLTE